MTGINIPLSTLGNHINLSGISEGLRSQSILTKFSNLRPLSEFFDFKRLSKPANFAELQSRVNYNLGYFASNYAAIAFMLGLYSLLSNYWLLFDIIFVSAGLFVIKKLNGRDLELGFTRLTTSQLYTGVLLIGIPVFFIASPIATLLWLIGANGGGLGGRPRAPYGKPPWGRPSWGRNGGSRKRQEYERQQREWESSQRFEELDSDSDLDVNYGVDADYEQEFSDWEALDIDDGYDDEKDMQLAIRDKERILVARAMARIRRAQELGRENVKLSAAESEALERRLAKDRAKGRKPIVETQRVQTKPRQPAQALSKKRGSRSSLTQDDQYIERPRSRTASAQNTQQLQVFQRRPPPEATDRRLRSSSGAAPLPYPDYPQEDYSYPAARQPVHRGTPRYVSGPAELSQPHHNPYPSVSSRRAYESASDLALDRRAQTFPGGPSRRRETSIPDDDEVDDEDDNDADQGVQLNLVSYPNPQNYGSNRVPYPDTRASQTGSLGRRRGGRR